MRWLLVAVVAVVVAPAAAAASKPVVWLDPSGDDHGPGSYIYPSSEVYRAGTFDLREVSLRSRGANVEVRVRLQAPFDDPWDSRSTGGHGFSLQQFHLYLDVDGQKGRGLTETLGGTRASFAEGSAWDKVVVLSPESRKRTMELVAAASAGWGKRVIVPRSIKVRGDTLVATVRRRDLGARPSPEWRMQALVLAADPFAAAGTMNVQAVNELPGAHRFGGGTDAACDPNVIDMLVPEGQTQQSVLSYGCPWQEGGERSVIIPLVAP